MVPVQDQAVVPERSGGRDRRGGRSPAGEERPEALRPESLPVRRRRVVGRRNVATPTSGRSPESRCATCPHHRLGAEAMRSDHDARDRDAGPLFQNRGTPERLREECVCAPIGKRAGELLPCVIVSVDEEREHAMLLAEEPCDSSVDEPPVREGSSRTRRGSCAPRQHERGPRNGRVRTRASEDSGRRSRTQARVPGGCHSESSASSRRKWTSGRSESHRPGTSRSRSDSSGRSSSGASATRWTAPRRIQSALPRQEARTMSPST